MSTMNVEKSSYWIILTFNFNKKKETGVKEVRMGDKIIVEAVV